MDLDTFGSSKPIARVRSFLGGDARRHSLDFTAGIQRQPLFSPALEIDPMPAIYPTSFFEQHAAGVNSSAAKVAPLLHKLFSPNSVLDVGCGVGQWLRAFHDLGVLDVMGVDGDYIRRESLVIPSAQFTALDLHAPRPLGRLFDLVICLEVAEHLPESCARNLVTFLVSHSSLVVFSAAVPGQGGTHHVNEQWPSYWSSLFAEHRYHAIDCIRGRIWEDPDIDYWYRQNMILYASQEIQKKHIDAFSDSFADGRDVVHPELLSFRLCHPPENASVSLPHAIRLLTRAAREAIRHRITWK